MEVIQETMISNKKMTILGLFELKFTPLDIVYTTKFFGTHGKIDVRNPLV